MPEDEKPDAPAPDPRVKELLERDQGKSLKDIVDEKTAAELQRWFGLPSFEQLEDEGVAARPISPQEEADRAKRQETLDAVAEWMLAGLDYRHHHAWDVVQFKPLIDVRVDPDMPLFAEAGLQRIRSNAEVRERERPEDIEEELKDQTPQALLRDLHRPELSFEIQYEVGEEMSEVVLDPVVEVRQAMATSWKLPNLGDPPGVALRKIFAAVREDLLIPWADLPTLVEMPNRRVTE